MRRQRKEKGFSLIELLIVVAIILIIASIAIPNLLAAKRQTNETAAVATIRTINTAQISYNSTYQNAGFASTLAALGGSSCNPPSATSACLIDSQTATGKKNGYTITLVGGNSTPNASYQLIASPDVPNQTGVRYFCSSADGVPRVSMSPIAVCDNSISPL
jgi:prepilin-type N-terminal cleavage/methylation domain-containing protein